MTRARGVGGSDGIRSNGWIMRQTWHDLLFAHWPVEPDVLRPLVPPPLEPDLFEGRAWIAIVPFWMSGIRLRRWPPMPGCAGFPEINVRTYARLPGQARAAELRRGRRGTDGGVLFLSLDASSRFAVRAARAWYRLPYFDAGMSVEQNGEWIVYGSRRTHRGAPAAEFRARYRPVGDVYRSTPGSLEHWLTERYCLHTVDRRGRVYTAEIDHPPWPLQPAEAAIEANTMAASHGVELPPAAPLLHFARRVDMVAWAPARA